ncbi:hypothetical protein [Lysobacter sp. ESA13C]|uniref:hypothetical protein n=1 Tax=Lysobacter sp. ESA13C TaxID=2862676 RepID=UPI001CC03B03|nr:hypothetical protein [Lysobacter sp. ESA13C]
MERESKSSAIGGLILIWGYQLASIATLVYLMISDWPKINWWNWVIFFPVNLFLSEIWPIYWLLHFLFN